MEYSYNGGMNNMPVTPEVKPSENFFMGLIGALGGAMLGAASIILFGQMGYIAALSGVILAFCTLKGYAWLGKGMSTKGAIVCVILMLVTPYVADYLNWGIELYKAWKPDGYTFMECLKELPYQLIDSDIHGEYIGNLLKLYLFVALGGVSMLVSAFKK